MRPSENITLLVRNGDAGTNRLRKSFHGDETEIPMGSLLFLSQLSFFFGGSFTVTKKKKNCLGLGSLD